MIHKDADSMNRSHPVYVGSGATELEMNLRDTIPQRIDDHGSKVEDLAGTGDYDALGG